MTTAAEVRVAASTIPTDEDMEFSAVMPCLNESATVRTCVKKALAAMEQHGIRGEVIVTDNGSTDGSQKIAMESGARVVAVEARGYGSALRGGIAAARGLFVLMGDADDSYDFTQAHLFVNKLREGYDLVFKYITLEVGLVVGVLLILAGTGAWGFSLAYWRSHNYGPLDTEKTLRIVIPGVVCFTLGFQTILSSFFVSVLGMSRR